MAKKKVVVTDRALAEKIDSTTPSSVVVEYLGPVKVVAVRVLRTYIQSVLGLVTAGMAASSVMPATDFGDLLVKSMLLSVSVAGVSALQNAAELMAKLDESNPQIRA